jgi:hypothetical protein
LALLRWYSKAREIEPKREYEDLLGRGNSESNEIGTNFLRDSDQAGRVERARSRSTAVKAAESNGER